MTKYFVRDSGSGEVCEIEAKSSTEAAEIYVGDGLSYYTEDTARTFWIKCYVQEEEEDGPAETIKIAIDPDEPPCLARGSEEHFWSADHELVGGLRENPGVQGEGGGIRLTEICLRCGREKITCTWAQDPQDGEQGLCSIEYSEPREENKTKIERFLRNHLVAVKRRFTVRSVLDGADGWYVVGLAPYMSDADVLELIDYNLPKPWHAETADKIDDEWHVKLDLMPSAPLS